MIVFKTMLLIVVSILLCVLLISVLIVMFVLTSVLAINVIRDLLKSWNRRTKRTKDDR